MDRTPVKKKRFALRSGKSAGVDGDKILALIEANC